MIVLDAGRVRFDGAVPALLATATGRVHQGPDASLGAVQTWRTGTGLIRSVGGSPGPGSTIVEPTVEDAYLLLRSATPEGVSP